MTRPTDRDLADTGPASERSSTGAELSRLRLVVLSGDTAAKHALPEEGSIVLGRSSFADIALDDSSVSRRHAAIHMGAALAIEDLGSANGTRVRGHALEAGAKTPIVPGEIIELGDVSVVITGAPKRFAAVEHDERPISGDIVVADPEMIRIHRLLERVAPNDISVLLLGETGSGKDVIAKRIHALSPRSAGPMIELNCAALPDTLLESELFGYDRGAFSGALKAKPGLLEAANGGTVFLDEIGDMPLSAQVKLLRVLESKSVTRLGELDARAIDVRYVAATSRDLLKHVEDGSFRSDLFFRLNGITIEIPPLRERPSEIAPLARAALARSNRAAIAIAGDVWDVLRAYTWPGNVRELFAVMDRAAILSGGGTIAREHVVLEHKPRPASDDARRKLPEGPLRREVAELEREQIERALEACGGNQTKAAEMLGISRRTLGSRMDEFKMRRPRKGPRP